MQINQNNYSILVDYLPDDKEIRQMFADYQEIIEMSVLALPENEAERQNEINSFFELLKEWMKSGLIIIPPDLYKYFEPSLEENINAPVGQPTTTAYSKAVNASNLSGERSINDINPMLQDKKKTETGTFISEKLRDYQPPVNQLKKNTKKPATSRLTYTIDNSDKKIINELELAEKKQYIYKEARQYFGKPIDNILLKLYGTNKFARDLVKKYPDSYQISEIKSVLTLIQHYDKYTNTARTLG